MEKGDSPELDNEKETINGDVDETDLPPSKHLPLSLNGRSSAAPPKLSLSSPFVGLSPLY